LLSDPHLSLTVKPAYPYSTLTGRDVRPDTNSRIASPNGMRHDST